MTDKKRALALGVFDGVHLGHAALLEKTKERAFESGMTPSVMSFDIHPDTLVFGREVPLINSTSEREEILRRDYGMEDVLFLHFTRELMCMPWRDFADKMLSELNTGHVVVGHDFCFGYRGEGTAQRLADYCTAHGVGCDIIPPVMLDGRVVSSTYIRELLTDGRMAEANRYLGHPHILSDTVKKGKHIGTAIGAPTVNTAFERGVLVPKHGVYASQLILEDGSRHCAVTNIGVRPTVGEGGTVNAETHLLHFSGSLYGEHVRVELYKYLREERKFNSLSELAEQIRLDSQKSENYFCCRHS